MAETPLERMAKAIGAHYDGFVDPEATPNTWAAAMEAAKAALEAIAEPDNDALEAMHVAMYVDPFDGTSLPSLGAGFEAAIRSILDRP